MAIPLLVAAGIAAGAGVAGAAGGAAAKVGNNAYRGSSFDKSKAYDPNMYRWGGTENGAMQDATYFRGAGIAAQGRNAVQADFNGLMPNYAKANQFQNFGMQDRRAQNEAAGLMMARARGQVPSIAQMQADRQMGQAINAQAAQAASARGGASLALAQQNAANNIANAQSDISGQAQINAANERLQAEQSAFGAYSGLRGADLASQQQAASQQQFNAQLGTQQQLSNAQLSMQQRQMNDAFTQQMLANEMGVKQAQLGANVGQQGLMATSFNNANSINAQINQSNANRGMDWMKMGLGAVSGGAGMAAGAGTPSDDRMKYGLHAVERRAMGGPVYPNTAYYVGEHGPEMVVPQRAHGLLSPEEFNRVRQRFAADDRQDQATKQWERSFGSASDATAGARDPAPAPRGPDLTWMKYWQDLYRADGGPVSAGMPYIVGERGPELIVPQQQGLIIPNHQLGGSMAPGYGGGLLSDERAKREAFGRGLRYGQVSDFQKANPGTALPEWVDPHDAELPDYVMPSPKSPAGREMKTFQRQDTQLANEALLHREEAIRDRARLEASLSGTPNPVMALGHAINASGHDMIANSRWDNSLGPAQNISSSTPGRVQPLAGIPAPPAGFVPTASAQTKNDQLEQYALQSDERVKDSLAPIHWEPSGGASIGGREVMKAPRQSSGFRPSAESVRESKDRGTAELLRLADAEIAGLRAGIRRGPSVARGEGEIDQAPPGWLSKAMADYDKPKTDPVTYQLGQGLAPYSFEYKPGMGPPGERMGIRAQGALTTPVTAPIVSQRPDGLLQIDQAQGLGTALGAIGHLAQKQAETDAILRRRAA